MPGHGARIIITAGHVTYTARKIRRLGSTSVTREQELKSVKMAGKDRIATNVCCHFKTITLFSSTLNHGAMLLAWR